MLELLSSYLRMQLCDARLDAPALLPIEPHAVASEHALLFGVRGAGEGCRQNAPLCFVPTGGQVEVGGQDVTKMTDAGRTNLRKRTGH